MRLNLRPSMYSNQNSFEQGNANHSVLLMEVFHEISKYTHYYHQQFEKKYAIIFHLDHVLRLSRVFTLCVYYNPATSSDAFRYFWSEVEGKENDKIRNIFVFTCSGQNRNEKVVTTIGFLFISNFKLPSKQEVFFIFSGIQKFFRNFPEFGKF